jgi:hypothetical protein
MKKENDTQKYALAVVAAVVLAAVLILGLDALGFATKVEGTSAVTVVGTVVITLPTSTVNLGSLAQSSSNNTAAWTPFNLSNDGNVKVNVTINASSLWSTAANPTSNYQFAANESWEGVCYSVESATTLTNMYASGSATKFLTQLNYTDACDTAEIEIAVTVPSNEPTGAKTSTVSFIASEA